METQKYRASDDPLNPRERTSFSKLLVGMAMAHYGFEPFKERQGTTTKIVNSLLDRGISIDRDNVKGKLDEAVAELQRIDVLRRTV